MLSSRHGVITLHPVVWKTYAQFAKAGNVAFFDVYVYDDGSSSTRPTGLARNRVINWQWAAIAAAIKQMMGEGKNK
jgi:predicted alpha/beta hydrolase